MSYKVRLTKVEAGAKTRNGIAINLPELGRSFRIFRDDGPEDDVKSMVTSRVVSIEKPITGDRVFAFNTLNSRYILQIVDTEG